MESKANNPTVNANEICIKVEINEGQWWPEDMLSEMKCKSEEFPISELQNEIVSCSSDTVAESKATVISSIDHKMDIKMEIKEEPGCLEIESESEKPSVSDTSLENKAKDDDSWIAGIDEDFPSKMSPRLHSESMCRFSDDATYFFPGKNSFNDSDTISEYQLLNSRQIFEESKTKFTSASSTKTCSTVDNCKMLHKCEICGRSFELLSDLRQHSINHEDKKMLKCKMGEKRNTQESNLKHEGKRPHICEICNKSFIRMSHLKSHILTHEGKRPHTCEICNKSFTRVSYLKCHIITHEGKRLHTCTICNKKFTQTSHLKRHTLIHEGKRPHKCEICKRTFIHRSALKQHELTHEGRRPHKCDICNKRYTHATTLKRHKLFHEGKKPYTCEICMKSFIQSSSLKEHKLIHEGKRPHICEICNKNFSNNSNLKRHKLTHEVKNT